MPELILIKNRKPNELLDLSVIEMHNRTFAKLKNADLRKVQRIAEAAIQVAQELSAAPEIAIAAGLLLAISSYEFVIENKTNSMLEEKAAHPIEIPLTRRKKKLSRALTDPLSTPAV